MSANDQVLPESKEKVFNTLITCYEEKDYKKGIKTADSILKLYPNNAKTLCMKHLINYLLNKDEETAEKGIKDALRLDPKNGTCWQTLGLFYRHCKNYPEAKKAFSMASMRDGNNLQIFMDLASLSIQVRDYPSYRRCYQKLVGKLSNRGNIWLGLMTGYFLEGNYSQCLEAIKVYRDTLEKTASYLRQELLYLEVDCYLEMGKAEEAIKILENGINEVLNEDAYNEKLAILYGKHGQLEKSEKIWNSLILRNCENYTYYRGLECSILDCFDRFDSLSHLDLPSSCFDLTTEQKAKLLSVYQKLSEILPKCRAVKRIQLFLCDDLAGEVLLNQMVVEAVTKGIPSLFTSLRSLFDRHPSKFRVFRECVSSHQSSLETAGTLHGDRNEAEPSSMLWILLLQAEIADYQTNTTTALELISAAIRHTPTSLDARMLEGRVLQRAGAFHRGAAALRECSVLDRGDRYLNTMLTQAELMAGEVESAEETVGYWTKATLPARVDLRNLQGCWFEVACGDSYYNRGDVVHANKMYCSVLEHFAGFVLDQFDFHNYSMRKTTLSSYRRFLRYGGNLEGSGFFIAAARGHLRCVREIGAMELILKDYFKTFPSVAKKVQKKDKDDDMDDDMDGVKLATDPKLLEKAGKVAKRLLSVDDELESLQCVMDWALESGDRDTCTAAMEKARARSARAFNYMRRCMMRKGMSVEGVDEMETGECSSADEVKYCFLLDGVKMGMQYVQALGKETLQKYGDLYRTMKRLDASEEELQILVDKAKQYYIFFEEYLSCTGN